MSYLDNQNIYYVYQLRLETSDLPFYIGKGKGKRIKEHFYKSSVKTISLKNKIIKNSTSNNMVVKAEKLHENLTEQEALDLEMHYITMYGRLDIGTGILANHTDGGEGTSGRKCSHETRSKIKLSKQLSFDKASNIKIKISENTRCLMSSSNYAKTIPPWKTTSIKQHSIDHVWSKAHSLYELYKSGYNTYTKISNKLGFDRSERNMFKNIVKKFDDGWVPLSDDRWIKDFIF